MPTGGRSAGKFEVLLQSQPRKYYKKANEKTARLLSECFKDLEQNPFHRSGRIKQLKAKQRYRYMVGGLLMDIDKERLEFAQKAVQSIIDKGNYPARVEATLDRKKALKGADVVLCTILAGGVQVWRHDIEIPKKYGVDINVGDTRGHGGIFRALRTIPVMLDICRDMERYCPDDVEDESVVSGSLSVVYLQRG